MLNKVREEKAGIEVPRKVFRPQPRVSVSVHKEEDTFVVAAPELERIVTKGGASGPEIRWQLKRQFARLGVNRALEKAGVDVLSPSVADRLPYPLPGPENPMGCFVPGWSGGLGLFGMSAMMLYHFVGISLSERTILVCLILPPQ